MNEVLCDGMNMVITDNLIHSQSVLKNVIHPYTQHYFYLLLGRLENSEKFIVVTSQNENKNGQQAYGQILSFVFIANI